MVTRPATCNFWTVWELKALSVRHKPDSTRNGVREQGERLANILSSSLLRDAEPMSSVHEDHPCTRFRPVPHREGSICDKWI